MQQVIHRVIPSSEVGFNFAARAGKREQRDSYSSFIYTAAESRKALFGESLERSSHVRACVSEPLNCCMVKFRWFHRGLPLDS
ncbi:hypothetical protein [Pyxidicoccus fallax]|uniref:hypothetical protein n=1 Tax=Pyxidicoccus fallax TaxID=394095 RepID=UPI00353126DC